MTTTEPRILVCGICLVDYDESEDGRRTHLDVFGHLPTRLRRR